MKFRRRVKKLVIATGMLLMLGLGAATTAYAAEPATQGTQQQQVAQSERWEGAGDTWRVRTADNTAYLTNSWFQDLDGSWYMLGADGTMYSGLVTDQSTGKSYLLNTNHDGTYGKMLTQDGVYTLNGAPVYLTFNQSHDGSYGAITEGLSVARSTGIQETALTSIPTDSTHGIQSTPNNSTNINTNNNTDTNKSQQQSGSKRDVGGGGPLIPSDNTESWLKG